MQNDNISSIKVSNAIPTMTLHHVLGLVEDWRANKKIRGSKIPQEIWDAIFILIQTETVSEARVLSVLSITKEQLVTERQARHRLTTSAAKSPSDDFHHVKMASTEFCEAKPEFPLEYKPAKAFSTSTSVVELYRPDGMLMKIHLCTDKFEDLLKAFFKGDSHA